MNRRLRGGRGVGNFADHEYNDPNLRGHGVPALLGFAPEGDLGMHFN